MPGVSGTILLHSLLRKLILIKSSASSVLGLCVGMPFFGLGLSWEANIKPQPSIQFNTSMSLYTLPPHVAGQVGSLFKANKMTTVKDGGHPDFARVFNGKKAGPTLLLRLPSCLAWATSSSPWRSRC